MRFSVLAILKMDCRTSRRKRGLFGRVLKTSWFAICKGKMKHYCLMQSSASMTAAGKKCGERERKYGARREMKKREGAKKNRAMWLGLIGLWGELLASVVRAARPGVALGTELAYFSSQPEGEVLVYL